MRKRLPDIENVLGTATLAAIFIVMLAAVFIRYVLNASLTWSEELARLGLVAITFTGIGAGFRRRCHISIDVSAITGPRVASALRYVGAAVSFIFLLAIGYNGIVLAQTMRASHTAALQMPLSWLYLAVGLASLLGAVRVAQAVIADLKGRGGC